MLRVMTHFFALGALVFACVRVLPMLGGSDRALLPEWQLDVVEVEPWRIDALHEEWLVRHGSPPGAEDMRILESNAIDEEILFREAVRIGLNRTDSVVRMRMVQNMEFLSDEPVRADANETALIEAALALGMDRTDIVIRRRLVQRMRAALESRARTPTEAELEAFVAMHPGRFTSEPRIRIEYGMSPGEPLEGEDRLLMDLSGVYSESELQANFGPALTQRVLAEGPGQGVVSGATPRGFASVRVVESMPAVPHPFAAIRGQAMQEVMHERRREALAEGLAMLKRRYRVIGAPGGTARRGPAA